MTERLYYEDSYLTNFEARVLECRAQEGGALARLDRSAFYPTSGGQPNDTGALGGANVLDVFADEGGEVWHRLDRALPVGVAVEGKIDWARRFDHMQQHAGEHILAGAIHRQLGGHVIGLHLGAEVSTIDADLPGGGTHLSDEQILSLEEAVNRRIQSDAPIVASFPDAATLAAMPLRKPPAVCENIRVVAVGDFEYCACGGTHPSSTGQIGLLKIVDARPSKGKLRVAFLCGMRAFREYQRASAQAGAAAQSLSTGVDRLPEAVMALRERLALAERSLAALRRDALVAEVPEMLRAARVLPSGAKLVSRAVEADAPLLRDLASALAEKNGVVALLEAAQENGNLLVFARSADVAVDMGALLTSCARAHGGKGGGRPDFAQGGGPSAVRAAAEAALIG